MSENNNYINYNNLKDIGKWFLVIFTVLFVLQWCFINNQLSDIKEQNRIKLDSLIKINSVEDIKCSKTKDGKYFIEAEELAKFDEKIKTLSKQVYSETHRAESIIDKDLDRLNLYMAIGIGFMTLLGIFVPILVNIISVQDIKEKQISLKKEQVTLQSEFKKLPKDEILQKAIKNADDAISKSAEMEKLKSIAEKILPKVYTLSLQISINRFFNMNANFLQEFALKGNYTRYINLLNIIKEELIKCKEDELHKIQEDESLKDTISDFSRILFDERFVFASYIKIPEITEKFIAIAESLNNLSNSSLINENQNYNNVINLFQELIELLENA